MNLASAYMSNIKTSVSVHSASAVFMDYHQHDHSSCLSVIETGTYGHKISCKVDNGKIKSWKVQKCACSEDAMSFEEEINPISQLIRGGHDTACLFMDIGGNRTTSTKRMEQKQEIFNKLGQISSQSTIIEFVYFGFTDTYCYDLRREVICSCDNVLQNGIDYWLKQVPGTDIIWRLVNRGSKLPSILKIKFTNKATKRQGSLCVVDLVRPRFFPETDDQTTTTIYRSFGNLRHLVNAVVKNSEEETTPGPVFTDYYLLTNVLAKFICGQGYMMVYAHLQECIAPNRAESVMMLDLIESLASIKVHSVAHDQVNVEKSSNYQINHYKSKYEVSQKTISEMSSTIDRLKTDFKLFRSLMNEKVNDYESKLIHANRQSEREVHDLKQQALLKRKAMVKDHRRATRSLKQLAFFRISTLKNENKEYQSTNQELMNKVTKYKSVLMKLRIKSSQWVRRSKQKETQLLGEIKAMTEQTKEIRKLFSNFRKNLVEKGVDLDN